MGDDLHVLLGKKGTYCIRRSASVGNGEPSFVESFGTALQWISLDLELGDRNWMWDYTTFNVPGNWNSQQRTKRSAAVRHSNWKPTQIPANTLDPEWRSDWVIRVGIRWSRRL
ncbi:hypothetical protein CIB48_g11749 [Xylaria polymorpha]|nr:hypothetical protein CIB48_g11749 [Xylaria polymorpha]